MKGRKIISLSILLSFGILMGTGILEYFLPHQSFVSTLHTVFGLVFTLGVLFHFKNNFQPIKHYLKGRPIYLILLGVAALIGLSFYNLPPVAQLMEQGTKLRASQEQDVNLTDREVIEMNTSNGLELTIDLVRAEHYWHPQMAIWTEDSNGKFGETLFVSKATAKGLFFGGRSKENFKSFDENKDAEGEFRRVDALPVWSHRRGVQYADGMFVPPNSDPLPDGITGATLSDNFLLKTSVSHRSTFKLFLEINVAFDDNEFYSEYDFPDDDEFHAGTGQLGQPSIVFEVVVDPTATQKYYLMQLVGHGHHSGQSGELDPDLSTLTTALELVERIVVGAKSVAQD